MRVVITRPRDQADTLAEALRAHGDQPIYFTTIQISQITNYENLDLALNRLSHFDWIIFTSVNAVEVVWKRLGQIGGTIPPGLKFAVVGPKTASGLEKHGIIPDFIPDVFIAEAIVPGLGSLTGKQVLLPLADLALDTLAHAVRTAGGIPTVIRAYHIIPADPDLEGLAELRNGVDAITFTSGSSALNFVHMVEQAGLNPHHLPGNPLVACIGPRTATEARNVGFNVDVVAEVYSFEGLIAALIAVTQEDPRKNQLLKKFHGK